MSSFIEFIKVVFSFSGLVSSNLKLTGEEKVLPNPKFKHIDLACPM